MNCPHKDAVGDTGACGPCYAAAITAIKAAGERDHIYRALETVTEQRNAALRELDEAKEQARDAVRIAAQSSDPINAEFYAAQERDWEELLGPHPHPGSTGGYMMRVERIKAERDAALRERARMLARVYEGESKDCVFCEHYPATGHSQQVPMCPMCCAESELTRLRALVEQREKERDEARAETKEHDAHALHCDRNLCDVENERNEANEGLREICMLVGDFDPSDGEGTSPSEVVALVQKQCATLAQRDVEVARLREQCVSKASAIKHRAEQQPAIFTDGDCGKWWMTDFTMQQERTNRLGIWQLADSIAALATPAPVLPYDDTQYQIVAIGDTAQLEAAFREGYARGYDHGSSDAAAYEFGSGNTSQASRKKTEDDEWQDSETRTAMGKEQP